MAAKELYFHEEIYEIKSIYLEIINGYTYDIANDIYVKHFKDLDRIKIIQKRKEIFERTKIRGVKTDREALEYLILENLWSQDKEDHIAFLEQKIQDNTSNANMMVVLAQKEGIMKMVQVDINELKKIKQERNELIGLTAEKYADEKYINHYLYYSFFKDENLKSNFFSKEDFDDLSDTEINDYFKIYNYNLEKFSYDNFKKIAVCPFFMNVVSMAYEDLRLFLNKSILEHTNYQLDIYNLTKRNVKILSEATASSPSINSQTTFSDLIRWYSNQEHIAESKRNERSGHRAGISSSINYV